MGKRILKIDRMKLTRRTVTCSSHLLATTAFILNFRDHGPSLTGSFQIWLQFARALYYCMLNCLYCFSSSLIVLWMWFLYRYREPCKFCPEIIHVLTLYAMFPSLMCFICQIRVRGRCGFCAEKYQGYWPDSSPGQDRICGRTMRQSIVRAYGYTC